MGRFGIELTERRVPDWYGPPEDALGELSPFEMGMRRFCFEQNRFVLIRVGDAVEEVNLFADFSLLVDELVMDIPRLARRERIVLAFPESEFDIELEPAGDQITCRLRRFGARVESWEAFAGRDEVLEALNGFLVKLLGEAVAQGYIEQAQADAFMAGGDP